MTDWKLHIIAIRTHSIAWIECSACAVRPQRAFLQKKPKREGLRRSSFLVGHFEFSHQKEREPGTDSQARALGWWCWGLAGTP
jgi:hypothetical protein